MRRESNNILTKLIRSVRKLYLNMVIEFGYIWEWSLIQRRSKLLLRGDGLFQVTERINDNTYKLDLPSEYNVSASFNVANLPPSDVGEDLKTNPLRFVKHL